MGTNKNNNDDIIGNPEYVTQEGLEQLKKQLTELKKTKRQEIVDRIENAKSLGDLTENSEYQQAKEDQIANETKIAEIEDLLSRAVIFSKLDSGQIVKLGATAVIKKYNNNDENLYKYTIVGSEEADPRLQKISYESPVGKAILGKKKGEKVKVITPNGEVFYTIVNII